MAVHCKVIWGGQWFVEQTRGQGVRRAVDDRGGSGENG